MIMTMMKDQEEEVNISKTKPFGENPKGFINSIDMKNKKIYNYQ